MHMLSPGIFVRTLPVVEYKSFMEKELILHPIEIQIGGAIGMVYYYFENVERRDETYSMLQKATGNYVIQDYYMILNKHYQNLVE